jgi:AcrR family transcriptional regulator
MKARTGTLRQRMREAATEEMLHAAERVMTRKGYHQSTMQEIAAEAGCATGTFYLYFKTKEVLFEAVLLRHARNMYGEAMTAFKSPDDPLKKIYRGSEIILNYVNKHRRFFRLFFSEMPMRHRLIEKSLSVPVAREHLAYKKLELTEIRKAQRAGLIRKDIPAEELQYFMDDVGFNVVDRSIFSPKISTVARQIKLMWGLISGGIGAEGNHARP